MTDLQIRKQVNAAFRFVVEVNGERQGAFTECTLPTLEWDIEEVKVGGLNTHTVQLPGRRKAARLTLKNGVGKSQLVDWYIEALKQPVERKTLAVTLLDFTLQPVITWHIEDSYPIRWTGPNLKTDDNTVAIHTLELVCGNITVTMG
jgi:phage tail-like protein